MNGVQIQNNANIGISNDKFENTFTIIPHDNNSIHTIMIGQASYADSGNSEIARQTLNYTPNPQLSSVLTKAFIKTNQVVPYYYGAMGDYFMGSKINDTQLSSQDPNRDKDNTKGEQLRIDSSNGQESGLYYYKIPNLTGSGNSNPYTPSLTDSTKYVSLKTSNNGALPDNPTFEKIFKKLVNNNSYAGLTPN